jgi:predicted hydrocarbon binding protein
MSSQNGQDNQENETTSKQHKPAKHSSVLENFSFLKEIVRFDEGKSEIVAADADWLILRADLLRELFEGLRAFLGRGADIAIKAAGKNSGRRFVDILTKRNIQLKEADVVLNLLLNQGGWGKFEMQIDRDAHKVVITIRNCVLARGVKSPEPSCYFLAGYFEGFCGRLFNMEMECVESDCMAVDGSICEFKAKPKRPSKP